MTTQNIIQQPPQNAEQDFDDSLFPIRVLSEKTAVGTSTLRAWERRYGLLQPERTPKGHRLYSQKDVKRVSKILDLLNDGHSLPSIADILNAQTNNDAVQIGLENTLSSGMSAIWIDFIEATIEATRDFNIERIDAIYNEAASLYPIDLVTERLIQPVITTLGKAWIESPEKGVAEEHFYTSWLKSKLGARFHHAYSQAKGAKIICACVPGSYHEIGLMLFSLSAMARGYRVLYFGADLPLNQLSYIAERSAAKAIVLGTHTQLYDTVSAELIELIPTLKAPVFVGGTSELPYQDTFQSVGGILLGSNISVAIRVFENHIPAYPVSAKGK